MTIDILPDIALLEIFDCHVNQAREEEGRNFLKIQAWHTLVHVCRKWRTIVLESPRRLDLRLLCTEKTPVKEMLAVWPPLPIVIGQHIQPTQLGNIIEALEHNDRVCQIDLFDMTNWQLEKVLGAMQRPFSALTRLVIELEYWPKGGVPPRADEIPPAIPEMFLGGSAPRLQHLELVHVPFPGLPKLLLSATDLVSLSVSKTPHSGYISPEAMARCLSTLTRLESLSLGFESPLSRPVQETQRPHPPTRSALPALFVFQFEGVTEYLEDLVARIDAPLLHSFDITFFFDQPIFDTQQLAQFVARTPSIQRPVEAHFVIFYSHVEITSMTLYFP